MAIPDYPILLLPVLRVMAGGGDTLVETIRTCIASQFNIEGAELAVKQRNGSTVFINHVAWVLAQLNMGKAITRTSKGVYRIAERGIAILKANPADLTVKDLRSFLRPEG